MLRSYLSPKSTTINLIRSFGQHNKKHIYGISKRFELVRYYPRENEPEDPPFEPSKLFKVQRVKRVKGNPYWEKNILKELNLIDKKGDITIVKNIPEVCAMLWKVKHLVKITPIRYPFGEPTENDINNTFLKDNGDCIVIKSLDPVRIEASERFEKNPARLEGDFLREDSRLKWVRARQMP